MSWKWQTYIRQYGPANPTDRYVMLTLAEFSHDKDGGRCNPSIQEICDVSKLHNSGIRKSLSRLKKGGWVQIHHGVRHDPSIYQLIAVVKCEEFRQLRDGTLEQVRPLPRSALPRSPLLRSPLPGGIRPLPRSGPIYIALNTLNTPPVSPKGGNGIPIRKFTRKQRGAMVGMDNGWRPPTTYPQNPKAQQISDRIQAHDQSLTGEELQYMQDLWREMKIKQTKEMVH